MRLKHIIFCYLIAISPFTVLQVWAQRVISPKGNISVELKENGNQYSFDVSYSTKEGKTNVTTLSSVGLLTGGKEVGTMKFLSSSDIKRIDDKYTMMTGKKKKCHNIGNERTYFFSDESNNKIGLTFRVYNDGVAFRYILNPTSSTTINDELTTYKVDSSVKRWTQKYSESYEDFFSLNEGDKGHWGYPSLFQINESLWMLLTEAGIERNNCASSLTNSIDASCYKVQLPENNLSVSGEWKSPWRVAIIGSLANVVESTLVTDVSQSSRIKDTSWIHPGVVSWIYWAYNHGSKDYQIVKEYIDMAAKLKLPYVLIDWEWDVMTNGGNIEDAVKYALSKDVKPIVWYNSSTAWTDQSAGPLYRLNKPEAREKEFSWLNKLGIAGVKIDFFSGDTKATMDYCIDLLEDAAKHNLLVNFHGATIPRGWQRTYPNLMSVEGVYGAEWYNNAPILTNKAAKHNATLPFIRNVVGPMDYTPCTFSDSQHPHITSHAHELALTVVFESALMHLADRPSSYLSQPKAVQDFFTNLPTVWDETKLLSGYLGEEVVMARKKGNVWYVGGLNGTDNAKTLNLDLSKLGKKKYSVTLYKDGKEQRSFNISNEASMTGIIEIPCLPRGGFVAVIK